MFDDIEEFGYDRDLDIDNEQRDNNAAWFREEAREPVADRFFQNDRDGSNGQNSIFSVSPSKKVGGKSSSSNNVIVDHEALDWHMRIDLDDDDNEKCSSDGRRSKRKLFADQLAIDDAIKRIKKVKAFSMCGGGDIYSSVEDENRFANELNVAKIFKYPPRNSVLWNQLTTMDGVFYILLKPEQEALHHSIRWCTLDNYQFPSKKRPSLLIGNFDDIFTMAEENLRQKAAVEEENKYEMDFDYFTSEKNLWVEKYKAKFYTDLLSDDGVNRALLTWLKLWDECVFKIARPAKDSGNSKFNVKQKFSADSKINQRKFFDVDSIPTDLDQHKRPQQKIVLLCGPPGIGKTTLAHICARHCGYFVCEMNASDDRTLEAFRKQLENVTQMVSTLDQRSKPHCLIIDEIDGAPTASINYLINFAKTSGSDANSAAQSSQKDTKKFIKSILKRPVICICNDLYATSLSDLRKAVLVIHVPVIENQRLTDRLNVISKREGLLCDSSIFEMLCEKTQRDIRSCLNTLQFLSFRHSTGRISTSLLKNDHFGLKDVHRSLFSIWQEIFTLPKLNRKRYQDAFENGNSTSLASRFKRIDHIVDSCGEIDKIIQGLFSNYLTISFKDPSMKMMSNGLEWLQLIDQLDRRIDESQSYDFLVYKKFVPILFHLLFASTFIPKLNFPQIISEAYFQRIRLIGVLQSLMNEMHSSLIRRHVTQNTLIQDLLPYLLIIIQPDLKPVNSQLYSERERSALQKLVDVMLDYNLTFRQERTSDGRYDFVLEPCVNEIVNFTIKRSKRKPVPYVAKQLIAREIDIRKSQSRSAELTHNASNKKDKNTPMNLMERKSVQEDSSIKNNTLRLLSAGQQQPMIKTFLTTANTVKSTNDDNDNFGGARKNLHISPIWYKYNEGSMNAVRRNLKLLDML